MKHKMRRFAESCRPGSGKRPLRVVALALGLTAPFVQAQTTAEVLQDKGRQQRVLEPAPSVPAASAIPRQNQFYIQAPPAERPTREERRALAEEQRRQAALKRQIERDQVSKSWWEFFAGITDSRAFYWHLGLAWASLLFACWRIKAGRWIPMARSLGAILPPEVKLLHYAAQAALFGVGVFLWGGWQWVWGAAFAIPVGLLATLLMMFLGFFDRPLVVRPPVGDINPPPRGQRPPPRQPGDGDKDRGVSW